METPRTRGFVRGETLTERRAIAILERNRPRGRTVEQVRP